MVKFLSLIIINNKKKKRKINKQKKKAKNVRKNFPSKKKGSTRVTCGLTQSDPPFCGLGMS